jgi:carbon starvation protein CstA
VDTSKPTLKQKAYHELKEFFWIALYLWVILALFQLYRSVILSEEHINVVYQGFAVINALALAKVLLIAKALHLGDWADRWPLIYPTLLKSALFTVVLGCFKILEDAGLGMYRGKSFQQSIADLGGGTLNGIFCLSLILFVTLIPFFVITELQGVLGEGKLMQLFFRPRSSFTPVAERSSDAGIAIPGSATPSDHS